MIDWKQFEKDLHWIAETGRSHTSREVAEKWKKIIEDEMEEVGNSVLDSCWELL